MIKATKKVVVKEVIQARYKNFQKPSNWALRFSGVDIIKAEDGCTYKLLSESDQSTPRPGSILILEPIDDASNEEMFRWTLYGFNPETEVSLDEF